MPIDLKSFYEQNKITTVMLPSKEVAKIMHTRAGIVNPIIVVGLYWYPTQIDEDKYQRDVQVAKSQDIGLATEFGRGEPVRGAAQGLTGAVGLRVFNSLTAL